MGLEHIINHNPEEKSPETHLDVHLQNVVVNGVDSHDLILRTLHTFQKMDAEFVAFAAIGRRHLVKIRDEIVYAFSAVQLNVVFYAEFREYTVLYDRNIIITE